MSSPRPPATVARPAGTGLGAAPELGLIALGAAGAWSLIRLYSDSSPMGLVLLGLLTSHALAWASRRRGLGIATSTLLSLGGLLAFLVLAVEPHTTSYGIPTGETWRTISDDLSRAWRDFGEVRAPVPPQRGFVLASVTGVWLGALIADWAAFRLLAAFEAVVPSFTLFTFAAALGDDRRATALTALYLATLLAFLLLHGAARRADASSWFASRVRGGPRAIVRGGVPLALVTLVAGMVVGPVLPGEGEPAVVDWRNRDSDDGSRVTVSPLVEIRGRLVNQSSVEVFTVESEVRSYWRLTALDNFDGEVWGSKGSFRKVDGGLPGSLPDEIATEPGVQQFTVKSLAQIWLPAAFRPEEFAGPEGVSFDRESSTLITDQPTSDNLVYRVRSHVPRFDQTQLAAVPGGDIPGDIAERYLALPADFPTSVREQAQQIAASAAGPYNQARVLQDFFRTQFTYDLEVEAGHDGNAVERFLAERRGYCEQFAGTFAAMARSLGLPARVAVGFTPGELHTDGLYHVSGRNAHAWPEVWFSGLGWVPFEPTPGRGAPGAQGYTGAPEAQADASGDPEVATTLPATSTTVAGGPGATRPIEDLESPELGSTDLNLPEPPQSLWARYRHEVGYTLLAIVLLALGWAGGVPLGHRVRRRRRRALATSPTDRALLAWVEAGEDLAAAGTAQRVWETPDEYARRATAALELDPLLLPRLARAATAAAYGPDGASAGVAEEARGAAAEIHAATHQRTAAHRRAWRWLDPRPLFRPSDFRPSGQAGIGAAANPYEDAAA